MQTETHTQVCKHCAQWKWEVENLCTHTELCMDVFRRDHADLDRQITVIERELQYIYECQKVISCEQPEWQLIDVLNDRLCATLCRLYQLHNETTNTEIVEIWDRSEVHNLLAREQQTGQQVVDTQHRKVKKKKKKLNTHTSNSNRKQKSGRHQTNITAVPALDLAFSASVEESSASAKPAIQAATANRSQENGNLLVPRANRSKFISAFKCWKLGRKRLKQPARGLQVKGGYSAWHRTTNKATKLRNAPVNNNNRQHYTRAANVQVIRHITHTRTAKSAANGQQKTSHKTRSSNCSLNGFQWWRIRFKSHHIILSLSSPFSIAQTLAEGSCDVTVPIGPSVTSRGLWRSPGC